VESDPHEMIRKILRKDAHGRKIKQHLKETRSPIPGKPGAVEKYEKKNCYLSAYGMAFY
jgi:hypothetical protein